MKEEVDPAEIAFWLFPSLLINSLACCSRRTPQTKQTLACNANSAPAQPPGRKEYLADRAVIELIEDAKSGQLDKNHELVDIIKTGIRKTGRAQLEILKGLLNQRALERPDLEHKHPDFQGNPND